MFLAIKKEKKNHKFVPIFFIIETKFVIIDYVQCPSEIYIRNKTEEIPDNKASNNVSTLYTRLQVHHIVSNQTIVVL